MKPDPKRPAKYEMKDAEPSAGFATVPIWLIVAFGLAAYWGGLHIDKHGGEFNPIVYEPYASLNAVKAANPTNWNEDLFERGKEVYGSSCQVCHQPNGLGLPNQFPPLAGSEWVTVADPGRIIRIVLDGLAGPITVKGETFGAVQMVAWRPTLNDKDIAAVLTYIRREWGNKASNVRADQVKVLREKTANHDGTVWKAEDLLKIQEGE